MNIIALIPARGGSQRIPGKNIKPLGGVPLMAWTIAAARESGLFGRIVVSTDSTDYMLTAENWGAHPFMRAAKAGATQADFVWVNEVLRSLHEDFPKFDAFAILRPTSPFRTAETIRRCWGQFEMAGADSIRAVEKVKQHPWKMWTLHGRRMLPLMSLWSGTPGHSQQYSSLPEVYVQNASLEMAWTDTVWKTKTISGYDVAPFLTTGIEGMDINTPTDWFVAEAIVASGKVKCPTLA